LPTILLGFGQTMTNTAIIITMTTMTIMIMINPQH
jgi:hypothetical protein